MRRARDGRAFPTAQTQQRFAVTRRQRPADAARGPHAFVQTEQINRGLPLRRFEQVARPDRRTLRRRRALHGGTFGAQPAQPFARQIPNRFVAAPLARANRDFARRRAQAHQLHARQLARFAGLRFPVSGQPLQTRFKPVLPAARIEQSLVGRRQALELGDQLQIGAVQSRADGCADAIIVGLILQQRAQFVGIADFAPSNGAQRRAQTGGIENARLALQTQSVVAKKIDQIVGAPTAIGVFEGAQQPSHQGRKQ